MAACHRARFATGCGGAGIAARQSLAEFYKRVMQARAMAEVADLEKIKAATDWKATAWRMERRNPKAWGRKRVITIHTRARRRRRSREEIEREIDEILGEDHLSAGAGE